MSIFDFFRKATPPVVTPAPVTVQVPAVFVSPTPTVTPAGAAAATTTTTIAITPEMLKAIAPTSNAALCAKLAPAMNEHLAAGGINSYLRVCHFLAQAAEETDHFKVLEEYASGAAYEGRKDLGNTHPGDGVKFKGRGVFMFTGYSNYLNYGKRIGIDLIRYPEKAADPDISVQLALLYWNDRGMSPMADRDDILACSVAVNGRNRTTGLPNGYEERKAMLAAAKKVVPQEGSVIPPAYDLGKVTASSLNVRSGPGTGFWVVSSVKRGDILRTLEKRSGFLRIYTEAGAPIGWVSALYVDLTGA